MSWIPKDATDLEKVKAVHDWLCAHVDYDYDTESAHDGEPWEYDRSTTYGLIIKNGIDGRFYPYNAYGALVEHYCVCDGYSYAFNLLMDQLGIPCQHISYGSHAWNSVQIDGSWYHVDATWDACSTPSYNRITTEYWWAWEPSSLCYNYFMKSDDGIQAVDTSKGKSPYAHAGYSKTYFHAATNPQYDNEADSFWEAQSPTAGVQSQDKIESFSLSQSQAGLAVGETMQLAMNDLEPSDANPRCASWSSSNPDVAYVFGDGTVLATGNGTATITCTTQYYVDVVDESRNHTRETRKVARTCEVTVGEAVELEPSFTTAQLVLGEQIAMRFGLDIPEGVDCSGGSAVFSITSPNGKKNRITDPIPLSQTDVSSGTGTYGFKFELSSIEMSQPITCTFTYGVDKQVTLTSSVRQYVQRVEELAQTEGVLTDSQVACVHAIANYGHYMQPFLQRNSNPVWRLDEDYQTMDVIFAEPGKGQDDYVVDAAGFVQQYAPQMSGEGIGSLTTSCSLNLDSYTTLDLFFDAHGAAFEASTSFCNKAYDAVLQKDGRYRIRISKIKALQLGSDAVVTGTVGGKEFCVTIQPLSYANIVLNKSAYATDDVARSAAASLYYYAYWSQHIND